MNKFEKGLDHFRTRGWARLYMIDEDETRCSIGALHLDQDDSNQIWSAEETPSRETRILAGLIREQYPEWVRENMGTMGDFNLVYHWNDAEGRTQEDVEALFEKAALQEAEDA